MARERFNGKHLRTTFLALWKRFVAGSPLVVDLPAFDRIRAGGLAQMGRPDLSLEQMAAIISETCRAAQGLEHRPADKFRPETRGRKPSLTKDQREEIGHYRAIIKPKCKALLRTYDDCFLVKDEGQPQAWKSTKRRHGAEFERWEISLLGKILRTTRRATVTGPMLFNALTEAYRRKLTAK
jgi:hypothetical protein